MGTDGATALERQSRDPTRDLEARLTALESHIDDLEAELAAKDERIAALEADLEETTAENERLDARVADLEAHVEDVEDDLETRDARIEARLEAHERKLEATNDRVRELQARELEKGAHLRADTVDETELEVAGGTLERITKADGHTYYRLPEQADPLARGGEVTLAYGDLLPIQQLARMDEEMLRSTTSALPTRLAAKLWKARTDASVGDDPWEPGGAGIKAYVTASDLKHWIRRQEPGISDAYAKKLVSRMIDPLLDLSRNRLAIRRRTERKNGLEYTERRIVLPADVDIPGETTGSTDQ
ncbi:hypothetical protein [Natrialbaceae archaeon AArc-T1-2]|uniref:hypothetical protein n=1 Tax=Natrialbaceae archaeon AArc-T1-2 TaxID=3053904 RepID=UPI00255A9818|nr:hypothetical protein [Natrialbaceae archaeon AArc-T1-2]WIV68822.1 hypothetical protein QQ977_16080 [Natrialbaceae archaeon AArc-T1-2]